MNLDEQTVIVFLRNDLEPAQDDIQTDHACFQLGVKVGAAYGDAPGITWLISKEKLNTKSLVKLGARCAELQIMHYLMLDSDVDPVNPTALAVFPLQDEHKTFFRKYPLRAYSPRVAKADAAFNGERGANAAVAQTPCS